TLLVGTRVASVAMQNAVASGSLRIASTTVAYALRRRSRSASASARSARGGERQCSMIPFRYHKSAQAHPRVGTSKLSAVLRRPERIAHRYVADQVRDELDGVSTHW